MKRKTIKKIAIWTISTLFFLTIVLAVHIWWMVRPRADASTVVMARVDVKQPLNKDEAGAINTWMYHQKGVQHVLVNPDTRIVIFTFYPVKVSGNDIVKNLKAQFNLKADRFIPTKSDLAGSCPVAGASFAYKVYKFVDNIL